MVDAEKIKLAKLEGQLTAMTSVDERVKGIVMKYTLVNPSKSKGFSHSNVFTIKVKCKIDDCLNLKFGTLDKCALHCEKGDYRTDCIIVYYQNLPTY